MPSFSHPTVAGRRHRSFFLFLFPISTFISNFHIHNSVFSFLAQMNYNRLHPVAGRRHRLFFFFLLPISTFVSSSNELQRATPSLCTAGSTRMWRQRN